MFLSFLSGGRNVQTNRLCEAPSTRASDRTTTDVGDRSEEIHVRNYDPYRGYDLDVVVADRADAPAFAETFYLRPGATESVIDTLDPGRYDVTIVLDSLRRKTATCEIGPAPEHTALVELGHGIASVTEGLY
jgi:hypothetical protein